MRVNCTALDVGSGLVISVLATPNMVGFQSTTIDPKRD
jgi:hypothetical protein